MRWSIKNSFSKRNYRLLRKKRIIGSNLPKSFLNTIWNWQTREQMKKNFICSKKSVRTLLLKLEPYFLSHAERGEPFQIQDFLGGIHLCRHFVPTPFRLPIPIFNFGGRSEIRLRGALRHTRFPSERTRPLCDPSSLFNYCTFKFISCKKLAEII